jgi:hypothetical protein
MKTLQVLSYTLLALAAGFVLSLLISGCAGLPPISGSYTGSSGPSVTLDASQGGITLTYTDACTACGRPVPVQASTPLSPALCRNCQITQDIHAVHAHREIIPSAPPAVRLHPVAGVSAGLDYVDPRAYRGWRGDCPGAVLDAWLFDCLLTSYGHPSAPLYNEAATDTNIVAAVLRQLPRIKHGGCLWLTVSGHGARVRDTSGDEPDGYDEQICLYNLKLDDDRVWAMLTLVHLRRPDLFIFMVSDTCHSGSNYRGGPLTLMRRHARPRPDSAPNLLHFAACPPDKYAWGSAQGGVFTTALIDAFDPALSYAEWFRRAARLMPSNQRPVIEHTGTDFRNRKIFEF